MELEKILEQTGLEEREIKVYLATLELGESTVLPISQKADIKRTYCYDILESLRDKGLVTYIEKNGRRRYSAEPPEKIKQLLEQRLENFDRILPELKSIYNQASDKPRVRFYEGLEAVLPLYEELKRVERYEAIVASEQLEQHLGRHLNDLEKAVVAKGTPARELIAYTENPPAYAFTFQAPHQEVRFLPQGVRLDTDMLILGTTLVLVSYTKDIHAVTIESPAIVETHRRLFDLLWKAGMPVKRNQTPATSQDLML